MNRNTLKNYAPQARRDFIAAVTDRAASYGLRHDRIEPMTEQSEVVLIAGTSVPRDIATKRKRLEERITRHGFEPTMEAIAYTWFNRFAAMRFMELHGYLEHGYRVLSHPDPDKPLPEILGHAAEVELPGLSQETVIELKLDGTRDPELYRMLVLAQCNALHAAMPFLFERIDDETELLLPENLLHSDSLIRKLVNGIDEADWQDVEIIGWLYQFYIAEKKDQVIGKVVKSEDIPAATQLFTPNWIVKYLVQNSLGRQWLATYPDSPLKQQMAYYIEPAEQTLEVQAQLKAITPENLNPEELTLLDPACGSGHILVEAYDLFKAIYQERGYRARDIPALILQKNLFGLEIDDRAAQLAAFALIMKARADDRRIFANGIQPHILAIQESKGLNAQQITEALNRPLDAGETKGQPGDIAQADVAQLITLFEHGKTFGSLIRVPEHVAEKLPAIAERVQEVLVNGGMLEQAAARSFGPFIEQSQNLAQKYVCVVANPPYLSGKGMNASMKTLAKEKYPTSSSDAFAMFVERSQEMSKQYGSIGLVIPYVWMFLSSYEDFRITLKSQIIITSLIQLEYNAFEPACVPVCTFSALNTPIGQYQGDFIRLSDFKGHQNQAPRTLEAILNPECGWRFQACSDDFQEIPGNPIAYWASNTIRNVFTTHLTVDQVSYPKFGMSTGDTRYIRNWFEVDCLRIGFSSKSSSAFLGGQLVWAPYDKGGIFRKWAGNWQHVVFWKNDGEDIRQSKNAAVRNAQFFCKPHVSWTLVTSSLPSFRLFGDGFLVDTASNVLYERLGNISLCQLLGFLNSIVSTSLLRILNPTLNYSCGVIALLPWRGKVCNEEMVCRMVEVATSDWDSVETSWHFQINALLLESVRDNFVKDSYLKWMHSQLELCNEMKALEEENNRLFIDAYGLQEELSPEVPDEQITLYRPNREEDIKRLISYAIGCIMGRYSLDRPGLIYAHSGNHEFWNIYHEKHGKHEKGMTIPLSYDSCISWSTFPADNDGIIPTMETDWFPDDASHRLVEFISVAWPKEHLAENLTFIAESLGPNRSEQPQETIRRYCATGFYKHHLQMYKRRPIYWLFSSGKQRAFQCLVYLHRYHEGTLARMRTEYVIPLQGKIGARIDQLADDIAAASSTAYRKKLEKERETLRKQHAELQAFDEQLRHYADQRIRLDLDDGVKVNYGKFGNLLAEVKAVTGGIMDEAL